ncbi:hypothetical protein AU468_02740 [Alkalispirochaeta sphaeroplastigenens]|uniref:Uncharacterized protein n=1 Tax=Alkalispirochaeta sphaeroplastigenens TaxID=1187066 RepID=A0A2S4JZ02_9SPIO|nr:MULTISPECIES: hypothetical protein [Alkalispirochaeta]POR04748.1 hypothetical protein AU468_02740 [Alkalispirochaeta sphaeroplastigenens]
MGKISNEARQQYFERIKEYKHTAEAILQREKSLLKVIAGDQSGASYKYLALAEERLNMASYFLLQNALSVTLLGVKNEAFLNDARKSCYQSVIYLEEVVSSHIDLPFSEYSDFLESIEGVSDENRYRLARKLGFTIQSVVDAFGRNSKWRWSFVELEGRYAAVAKNLVNFKTFIAGLDPQVEGYQARMGMLELIIYLLSQSADRYREKYELSTLRIDDFKRAISFLAALRRIYVVLGEAEKSEEVKKKMEVWKAKMDADEKNQAQQRKRKG